MPITDHTVSEEGLTRLDHILIGLLYRIPICCILRWTFSRSWGVQAVERGSMQGKNCVVVPCGVFHKAEKFSLIAMKHGKEVWYKEAN